MTPPVAASDAVVALAGAAASPAGSLAVFTTSAGPVLMGQRGSKVGGSSTSGTLRTWGMPLLLIILFSKGCASGESSSQATACRKLPVNRGALHVHRVTRWLQTALHSQSSPPAQSNGGRLGSAYIVQQKAIKSSNIVPYVNR